MFIPTEATPNPDTLKFLPETVVLERGSAEFESIEDAALRSPLAAAIFAVDGVRRVYFGRDFLSVTKEPGVDWAHLRAPILAAIMDHVLSGAPNLFEEAPETGAAIGQSYEGEAAEIVEQIVELIETRIRPAVAQDGGDILFHSWAHEEGLVRLTMRGACAGCPSSTLTLKQGIENMLRHYVPEVRAVEAVA